MIQTTTSKKTDRKSTLHIQNRVIKNPKNKQLKKLRKKKGKKCY